MSDAWKQAEKNARIAANEMRRLIPSYSYSNPENAHMTNDQFCRLLTE